MDARCRICDTRLSVAQAYFEGTLTHGDAAVHLFCSEICKDSFDTSHFASTTQNVPPMIRVALERVSRAFSPAS